jgi:hypothetical protein
MTTDLVPHWTLWVFVVVLAQRMLTAMASAMMQTTAPIQLLVTTVTLPMKLAKAHLVQDVQLSRLATTTHRRQLVQMLVACLPRAVILALELQTVPARSSMETPTTTASVTWMK